MIIRIDTKKQVDMISPVHLLLFPQLLTNHGLSATFNSRIAASPMIDIIHTLIVTDDLKFAASHFNYALSEQHRNTYGIPSQK